MTLVEFPRKQRRQTGAPLLILLDLQKEYQSADRSFSVPGVGSCLAKCKELLDGAREVGLPIAHFRQLQNGPFFNEATLYSQWIDEFTPRPCEMVYERSMLSCYHNPIFSSFMEAIERPILYLAGLTSDRGCLATVLDAIHRHHTVYFISDASAARPIEQWSSGVSHAFITDLIAQYCPVITADEALQQFRHTDPARWDAFGA